MSAAARRKIRLAQKKRWTNHPVTLLFAHQEKMTPGGPVQVGSAEYLRQWNGAVEARPA
jgi:hypothetical protein